MSYATRDDIEARFSKANVSVWADTENTQIEVDIAARIVVSLAEADRIIDDVLRTSPYDVPVRTTSNSIPAVLIDIAAKLAAVWLYDLRGSQDTNPETGAPVHKLSVVRKMAEQQLYRIRTGVLVLADVTNNALSYPKVEDL